MAAMLSPLFLWITAHFPMATQVDIANNALNMVGQQVFIAALTDASVSARLCNINMANCVRTVLGEAPWSCACRRAQLVQTTIPLFEWSYAYILPPDYVRMVKFNDTFTDDVYPLPYEIEGPLLLTNETMAPIVYVADLSMPGNDVGDLSVKLFDLVSLQLASALAWPLQQDATLRDRLNAEYDKDLRVAKAQDARERRKNLRNPYRDSAWLPARINSTANSANVWSSPAID